MKRLLTWISPLLLLGVLLVALFVKNELAVVPMISFVWLLVLREKGYWKYALPVFIVANAVFFIAPGLWSGLLAVGGMILLALLPARHKVLSRWQLASYDGSWKSWWLPRSAGEDMGSVVGDASVHLIVIAGAAILLGILFTGGIS